MPLGGLRAHLNRVPGHLPCRVCSSRRAHYGADCTLDAGERARDCTTRPRRRLARTARSTEKALSGRRGRARRSGGRAPPAGGAARRRCQPPGAHPVPGQQLRRQPRVEVGQAAPGRERPHVVGERLGLVVLRRRCRHEVSTGPMRSSNSGRGQSRLSRSHHDADLVVEVGEATVRRMEQVHVRGQPVPLEDEPGLAPRGGRGRSRRRCRPCRSRATTAGTGAGAACRRSDSGTEKTASTQPSASVATSALEDAPVAVVEDLSCL